MATLENLQAQLQETQATLQSLQTDFREVKEVQSVERLLNHYTALHDEAMYDLKKREEWGNLFAIDGVAIYPFGTHRGREGMGHWAFGGVSYFQLCQLLSSNFDISFSKDWQTAFVRTNCIAQWLKDKSRLDDHFDEGGFYHWELKKEQDQWKIAKVQLTITWTLGEDPTGVGPKAKL